ncbi:hypothetical protein HMPREF9211_1080 [Lactobacillus iners LactinV 01V1-a]|uniref:Uncharacterized protein n=1 Tax=Lactobacillus iners LactinV 01V1-a TaxID=879297 RepID=E1NU09_9LACO|nr:hypothetical protein HMPREF9211_1080 [Lactobacillus iners LactinV 01V1-a]
MHFINIIFLNSFDKARLKASKEHLDALQSKILTFENIKAKENLLSQLQQFKIVLLMNRMKLNIPGYKNIISPNL